MVDVDITNAWDAIVALGEGTVQCNSAVNVFTCCALLANTSATCNPITLPPPNIPPLYQRDLSEPSLATFSSSGWQASAGLLHSTTQSTGSINEKMLILPI